MYKIVKYIYKMYIRFFVVDKTYNSITPNYSCFTWDGLSILKNIINEFKDKNYRHSEL
jgi:hypothetical protein